MKYVARILASALLLAGGSALAHENQAHPAPNKFDASQVEATPFGQEGNPKKVARTIRVSMNDRMRFEPENLTVRKGETEAGMVGKVVVR
jgi:uncharacterized cupredoxin-like copper-binding protein